MSRGRLRCQLGNSPCTGSGYAHGEMSLSLPSFRDDPVEVSAVWLIGSLSLKRVCSFDQSQGAFLRAPGGTAPHWNTGQPSTAESRVQPHLAPLQPHPHRGGLQRSQVGTHVSSAAAGLTHADSADPAGLGARPCPLAPRRRPRGPTAQSKADSTRQPAEPRGPALRVGSKGQ